MMNPKRKEHKQALRNLESALYNGAIRASSRSGTPETFSTMDMAD